MVAFLSIDDRSFSPIYSLAEDKKSEYGYNDRGMYFCPKCGILFDEKPFNKFPPKNQDFCCGITEDLIIDKVESDFFDMFYQPFARRHFFSTSVCWGRNSPKHTIFPEWDFEFCLYCGKQLPKSLLDQWLAIVKNDFGVGLTIKLEDMLERLPEEFRTDKWWKKRGL